MVLIGVSGGTILFKEDVVHGGHISASARKHEFATGHPHNLFPINGTLLSCAVLIFQLVQRVVVDLFKIPLGLHKLSVFEIVLRLVDVGQLEDDGNNGDEQSLYGAVEDLVFEQLVVGQVESGNQGQQFRAEQADDGEDGRDEEDVFGGQGHQREMDGT